MLLHFPDQEEEQIEKMVSEKKAYGVKETLRKHAVEIQGFAQRKTVNASIQQTDPGRKSRARHPTLWYNPFHRREA